MPYSVLPDRGGALLKAKEFEKGKANISPKVKNRILMTKIPAHTLINNEKNPKAIQNEPKRTIFNRLICLRSKNPTIGISNKKIKNPFNVINKPV